MKLTLVAVGKVREDPTKWLFESYVKRIRNPFELVEVEVGAHRWQAERQLGLMVVP